MRQPAAIALILVVTPSCREAQPDRLPSLEQSVTTNRQQEAGIRLNLARVAKGRGFRLASQGHFSQEFGCSNVYSLKRRGDEIIVMNPFGLDYKILAYASNREGEDDLASVAKEIAQGVREAPLSEARLC